jgi:hypothetical protein
MSEDELLLLLGHDEKSVRRTAIEALRELLPGPRARLVEAMASPDWKVRAAAAAVLDHAEQDAELERVLTDAVRDPDARVRDAAFHSLSCGHCKPEGCVSDSSVDVLVDGMLHDPSVRVRRKLAGGMMWGQQGRGPGVIDAFRTLLASDPDRVLRDRSATFLASLDVRRDSMPFREWWPAFLRRKDELLASS